MRLDTLLVVPLGIVGTLPFEAGVDARLEQDGVEGLGQVVFRAQLDAAHHAVHFAQGGDHDDRDMTQFLVRLHGFQDLIPVHYRHHDIEQDEVEVGALQLAEGVMAIHRQGNVVAILLQAPVKKIAVELGVIHHEDGGFLRTDIVSVHASSVLEIVSVGRPH